jgi:hypothetical protein
MNKGVDLVEIRKFNRGLLSRHQFFKPWYVGNLGRKSNEYENGK